ncbi:hypothetical protein RM717_04465 [Streptomyces griseus]|uniref:Uncharacterized protein n=1 Tax=Streptomyces stephensoniae TaxID=3375367 RepID=A0ABU2VVX1_9ACTN|nr:hypothetical protein [Streptomyces griseus]MDT0489756.1 hypothetical protein [Streptomyces griseus]
MRQFIARLYEVFFGRLTPGRAPQLPGLDGESHSVPPARRARVLVVCRTALLSAVTPCRPYGPYSPAAYARWERAEQRLRGGRRREGWPSLHGVDGELHPVGMKVAR